MDFQKAWDLITGKIEIWLESFVKILPNLLIAVLIIVLGIMLAKKLSALIGKIIRKFWNNNSIVGLFESIIRLALFGIVIFTALSILKLDKVVTTILAGAGLLGLGLAFAFQDIAANFISGVFISFRKPFHLGDIVKLKGYMGKVLEINLRDTVVKTFQGEMVIIPNKEVFQNPIENYSLLGKRRVDLKVGVSYGDDLEKVKKITLEALKDIPNIMKDEEITLFFNEFADSSINFVVRIWVNTPEQPAFLEVSSLAIMKIKKAFDEHNISIPFPIRTLDFGIKGGQTFSVAGGL